MRSIERMIDDALHIVVPLENEAQKTNLHSAINRVRNPFATPYIDTCTHTNTQAARTFYHFSLATENAFDPIQFGC